MGVKGESERVATDPCSGVDREGRESVGRGAKLLGISARQMKRLRRKMKERGVEGLLHANRGKQPWNKTALENRQKVIKLARGRYQGLNDTHLTEKLKEKEKITMRVQRCAIFASSRDRRRAQARGKASLQAARAKSPGRSSGVVGW